MNLKNLNAIKTPKKLILKLSNKRIKDLFKEFEKNFDIKGSYAVAVSGGPDSLALAFLTKVYSIKHNINCTYFIVNHKARYKLFKNQVVASLLNEMGIDDEEIVRKISIDFAMLLNRFFMYNLSKEEFASLETDFFQKLNDLVSS